MQIKYLKDAPLGQAGETADVPDDQAGVLIAIGFAEVLEDKKPKATKPKPSKNTELGLD